MTTKLFNWTITDYIMESILTRYVIINFNFLTHVSALVEILLKSHCDFITYYTCIGILVLILLCFYLIVS